MTIALNTNNSHCLQWLDVQVVLTCQQRYLEFIGRKGIQNVFCVLIRSLNMSTSTAAPDRVHEINVQYSYVQS